MICQEIATRIGDSANRFNFMLEIVRAIAENAVSLGVDDRAARRDAGRDVEWPGGNNDSVCLLDESPAPDDEVIFIDLIQQLRRAMSPEDWPIIEHLLIGCTAEEIAERLDCSERTVRRVRQRAKVRLLRLIGAEAVDVQRR